MKTIARLIIAGALVFGFGQFGYAQMTPPAAPATPAAPAAPAVPKVPAAPKAPMSAEDMAKKAKAKECSAKADAQELHGKARQEFRAKCKKS
ncbi:MAG: PsiF family protein [Beijerinckiaceae bacterium]